MSLKALARSSGGTISEMLHFPVAMIEVDPDFNVRLDTPERRARIREYANTMKNPDVGFLRNRPLTVRLDGERVFVVDGHTRLAAVTLANSEGAEIVRLPCLSAPAGSDATDLDYQLFQSNSGEPLSGLEQGTAFKRLLAKGQEVADIAQRLGKSQGHIRNMLALVAAEPAVRQAVVAGRISATEAAKVVKANGSQAGTVIAKATEHARSEGRERARPRDVEAVTKPRTEPVSLCSLAIAVVKAWQTATGLDEAVTALANHLGPLAR
jgi:ParB family transcriptional regulator, chromosome partitioning protein